MQSSFTFLKKIGNNVFFELFYVFFVKLIKYFNKLILN